MRKRLIRHRQVLFVGSAMACMGVLAAAPRARAQGSAPPTPVVETKVPGYDVVSIKPDTSDTGRVSVHVDDGNFDALNVSLKNMILSAYGLKEAQLFGLPKWGDSQHFDIKAKIIHPDKEQLEAMTLEQFRSMQQPILTDRFPLKFHREMKSLRVYELVMMKGGPKFQAATAAELEEHQGIGVHNHHLVATVETMAALVDNLSGQLQRVVVDKTGLTARYNYELSWSPDDATPQSGDAAGPPNIFTALQEQLGLKLQPGNAEIDTFVIDHVELPSEN